MQFFIGMIVVFSTVFGSFVMGGGHLLAMWQPLELVIIAGAATGAFITAHSFKLVKQVIIEFIHSLKPNPHNKIFFLDLLALFFNMGTKIRSAGLLSVEEDIEKPHDSPLFSKYPKILHNTRLMTFICDNMRIVISGNLSNYELEALLDNEIELIGEELTQASAAVANTADSFPGFGIVAAVMGIVHTMEAIGGEVAEIGQKVAAALVGTFLGVLLAYGIVGPIGQCLGHHAHAELRIYFCVKTLLLAFITGTAPKLAVEFARKALNSEVRPGFYELEEHLQQAKKA